MAATSGISTPRPRVASAEESSPPGGQIANIGSSPGAFSPPKAILGRVITEKKFTADGLESLLFDGVRGLDIGVVFVTPQQRTLHFVNEAALKILNHLGFDEEASPAQSLNHLVKGIDWEKNGEVQRIRGLKITVFPPKKPFALLQKVQICQDDEVAVRTFAHDLAPMIGAIKHYRKEPRKVSVCAELALDLINARLNPSDTKRNFKLYDLLSSVITIANPDKSNIKFEIDYQVPAKDLEVFGPFTQLHEILVNLARNAKKHAFNGIETEDDKKITLRVSLVELKPEQGCKLRFEVEDNGIGIDETIKDTIFQPGVSTALGTGNYGLGMSSVADEIGKIEAQLGPIVSRKDVGASARSSTRPGTIFSFDIFLANKKPEPVFTPPPTPRSPSDPILIVEDNEINSIIAEGLFTKKGYTNITTAKTFEDAKKLIESNNYSMIFLDDGLNSGHKGYELIPIIQQVYQGKTPPELFLFSATSDPALMDEYKIRGCHQFLPKPTRLGHIDQHVGTPSPSIEKDAGSAADDDED
ncbi:MAG: response regulator [Parachlamydiales bacterium]|nr:response regulator [Parachlamydiales bacterium]